VIQVIWHVDSLRGVLEKFTELEVHNKQNISPEFNLLLKF
jgi:hypothetical protein